MTNKTFRLACPSCGVVLEFDGDPSGETYQCPECNSIFAIPQVVKKAKKVAKPKGCYFMGLFLGVIGIFIANMTNGPAGAKEALRGFIFQLVCVVVGFFALFILPYVLYDIFR